MFKVHDFTVCKVSATFLTDRRASDIIADLQDGYSGVFSGVAVMTATVTETRRAIFRHSEQKMIDVAGGKL